jgi:hypothetical protein
MAGRSEPVCQNVFVPGRAPEVGKSQKSTVQATLFLRKPVLILAIETSCATQTHQEIFGLLPTNLLFLPIDIL